MLLATKAFVTSPLETFVTASIEVARGDMTLVRERAETDVHRGEPLRAHDALATGSAFPASLAITTGSVLDVGRDSAFSVASMGALQRFDLHRGSLSARVAKLPEGGRFVVATHDAEVEVRGTRFVVSVVEGEDCEYDTSTRVAVSEGVVVVRYRGQQFVLHRGDRWPSRCTPGGQTPPTSSVAPLVPPVAEELPPAPHRAHAPGNHALVHRSPPLAETPVVDPPTPPNDDGARSSLDRENDAFARALTAARAGESAEAARLFEEFVAQYPASPLADSTAIEVLRLVRRVDPTRARRFAEALGARPAGPLADEIDRTLRGTR